MNTATLRKKIGRHFMLGFQGEAIPAWLKRFAEEFSLGGVILFDYSHAKKNYENNIRSKEQVKALIQALHALPSRPLVFVDQEGGKVRRLKEKLGFQPLPSAKALPQLARAEQVLYLKNAFHELVQLGVDVNLAPVVDLDLNPENPDIGKVERSFSADATIVREMATLTAKLASEVGLKLCLKHFPGLGGATVNSHHELTNLSASYSLEQEELFYELLPQIPGKMLLLSHGIVDSWAPGVPVSISNVAINRIRKAVPEALLLTDDLQMQGLQKLQGTGEAVELAMRAGADMVIIGNNMLPEEAACFGFAEDLLKSLEAGKLPRAAIQASQNRLAALDS